MKEKSQSPLISDTQLLWNIFSQFPCGPLDYEYLCQNMVYFSGNLNNLVSRTRKYARANKQEIYTVDGWDFFVLADSQKAAEGIPLVSTSRAYYLAGSIPDIKEEAISTVASTYYQLHLAKR